MVTETQPSETQDIVEQVSPTLTWTTTIVEKTLKTEKVKGADGKNHIVRTAVQKVPYTYPKLSPRAITSVMDIAQGLEEILSQPRPGFNSLASLVELVNYGLYAMRRAETTKGQDVRYSVAQRNAIKMFTDMLKQGLLERDVVIAALLKQGIQDAEGVVEAALAGSGEALGEAQALNGQVHEVSQ